MSLNTDLCRICLAVNVRLQTIAGTPLQTVFEQITNTLLHTADSRPVAACYICCAQLKRCLNLMHTSAKAEKMLTRMLQHNPKGSNKLMKSVMDHNGNSLRRTLSVTPVDCIDTFSFNAPITVKEEQEYLPVAAKHQFDYEESIDSPQVPEVSDLNNKLDLKDEDVLRSIRLEQECYSYNVKIEPMEDDSWQDAALEIKSESTEQVQAIENDLLVKKKRKHVIRHKSKHNEKHLKYPGDASVKTEKKHHLDFKSSKQNPESKKQSNKKYFECDDCQYRFHRKCHLETHMILHNNKGEKPFQCSYCQKRFNFKHGLDRHLKTHTGEKSFQCPMCQKMFVEKSVMKIHIRTHTGEQPYQCDICEKRFKQRNDLKRHRRTHTGEKPFKCDLCQRRFNERSKVTRHQKKHYGEKLTKRDFNKLFK